MCLLSFVAYQLSESPQCISTFYQPLGEKKLAKGMAKMDYRRLLDFNSFIKIRKVCHFWVGGCCWFACLLIWLVGFGLGHTWQWSGVTSVSEFRNHSWQTQETKWDAEDGNQVSCCVRQTPTLCAITLEAGTFEFVQISSVSYHLISLFLKINHFSRFFKKKEYYHRKRIRPLIMN